MPGKRLQFDDEPWQAIEAARRATGEKVTRTTVFDRRSITGVAGPEPDERGNPVGLVYLACAQKGGKCVGVKRECGAIGRSRVRYAAAAEALALIARLAGE